MNKIANVLTLIIVAIFTLGFGLINWMTHLDMARDESSCKKITFKEFKKLADKLKWVRMKRFHGSIASGSFGSDGYIHANIFRIGDISYRFGILDFFRADSWRKNKYYSIK